MQVRPAGQAGYPTSLVASLDTVPVKCCVPLLTKKRLVTGHSVTPHTHAPLRGAKFLFSPAGRSNAHTQLSNVDQKILHGEGSETPP